MSSFDAFFDGPIHAPRENAHDDIDAGTQTSRSILEQLGSLDNFRGGCNPDRTTLVNPEGLGQRSKGGSAHREFLEMLSTKILRHKGLTADEQQQIEMNASALKQMQQDSYQGSFSHSRHNCCPQREMETNRTLVEVSKPITSSQGVLDGRYHSAEHFDEEWNEPAPSVPMIANQIDAHTTLNTHGDTVRHLQDERSLHQAFLKGIQSLFTWAVSRSSFLKAVSSHTYEAHHPLVTSTDLGYMLATAMLTIVCLDLLSASFFTEHSSNNAPREGSSLYVQHIVLLIFGQVFFAFWMLLRPLVRKRGRASGHVDSRFEWSGCQDCDSVHGAANVEGVGRQHLNIHRSRRHTNSTDDLRRLRGFGLKRRLLGIFSSVSEWEVLDTPSELWREYTRTWFWFDFAVTFPWNLPYFLSFGLVLPRSFLAVTSSVHLLRWIRVLTIGRSSEPLIATRRYLRFVRMLLAIISFAHFCALLFPIVNPSLGLSYLASLYYIMTTMTSVGYGDVTPRLTNDKGLVFAIGIMVIGVAAVGIFTASLTQYLNSKHHGQEAVDGMRARLENQLHGQFGVSREARKYLTKYFTSAITVKEFVDFWRSDLPFFPSQVVAEVEPFVISDLITESLLMDTNTLGGHLLRSLSPPSALMRHQLRAWLQQLAAVTVSRSIHSVETRPKSDTSSPISSPNVLPIPPHHSHFYRRRFTQGELVFEAGDLLDGLIFVVEGEIDVFVPLEASPCSPVGGDESGGDEAGAPRRRSIALLRAGQLISLAGAFVPTVAMASARCIGERAEILILSRRWILTAIAFTDGDNLASASASTTDTLVSANISSSTLGRYLSARRDLLIKGITEAMLNGGDTTVNTSIVHQIRAVLGISRFRLPDAHSTRNFEVPLVHPICAPLCLF